MELIGQFSVDSGMAMVGDPCYLSDFENWDDSVESFDEHPKHKGKYSYLGACNATLEKGYGQLGLASAVAFNTGYGDGLYPVYAKFNDDGRISRIVIEFDEL